MRILWICWPRTGSTWAASALAELLQYRFIGAPKAGPDAVSREHWTVAQRYHLYPDRPYKTVLGIRDPRDAVVSHYYMLCRENKAFSVENLSLRQYIERFFVRERVPVGFWEHGVGLPTCSWDLFYREWLAEDVDVRVRHEDLMADRAGQLSRILNAVGLKPKVDIGTVVANYATYTRPIYDDNYTRRKESGKSILRGKSHWREYLGPEELGLIYDSCGELMHECGYE